MSVRNKEYHDASGQSQNEAMACIWAADKIDNSHLWTVTFLSSGRLSE
jgi:hypothetical protein